MDKKKTKTQQAIKREKKLNGKDVLAVRGESASDFDFGGLPKVDLKKNLGCG